MAQTRLYRSLNSTSDNAGSQMANRQTAGWQTAGWQTAKLAEDCKMADNS
jgi:uncharacterized membrane protein